MSPFLYIPQTSDQLSPLLSGQTFEVSMMQKEQAEHEKDIGQLEDELKRAHDDLERATASDTF